MSALNFDINKTAQEMIAAAAGVLNPEGISAIQAMIEDRLNAFASEVDDVAALGLAKEDADDVIAAKRDELNISIQTDIGVAVAVAQQAVNAALDVLNQALETAATSAISAVKLI
jgi:hypothetical protein